MWKYKNCGYSEYEIRKALDEVLKMLEQDPIPKLEKIKKIVNGPTVKAVPLDKVKQAREELEELATMDLLDIIICVTIGTIIEIKILDFLERR